VVLGGGGSGGSLCRKEWTQSVTELFSSEKSDCGE
jgi:hypothetical protein